MSHEQRVQVVCLVNHPIALALPQHLRKGDHWWVMSREAEHLVQQGIVAFAGEVALPARAGPSEIKPGVAAASHVK